MNDWITKLFGEPDPTPTPQWFRWLRYTGGLGIASTAGYAGWLLYGCMPAVLAFGAISAFALYMTWRSRYLP